VDQFDSEDDNKGRPGVPVDAGRLITAIRRHWRVIPTAVAAGALLGLAIAALLVKPSYTAKATMLWEPPSDADPSDRSFLTQVDSIKLTSNLKEVKRRLRSKATLDELKEKINLLFDGQSHLVVIEATDSSAKGAVNLANTVVDVFLNYQRSIGHDRGSERLRRVDADIAAAHSQLKSAQDAYDVFRREIGVSDFEVELKLALQKVDSLKQTIETSQTEARTEATKEAQFKAQLSSVPATQVSMTTVSNPDEASLAHVRTELAEARGHLSADHPTVLRLQRQVETLEAKIKSSTGPGVTGPVSISSNPVYAAAASGMQLARVAREAAESRAESAKKQLEEANVALAKLSSVQGRAQQLLSAIAAQEAHRNELEALNVRTRDQIRSAASDFRVVTPATPPEKPNPSKRRAVVIRTPVIALVLALLGIVGYELRGLRVHTAREAGFWANAAVIASSTWPREQTTLGQLIDELSDAAPAVKGTTLVVGARVNEVPLAREIAYWLSHLTSSGVQRGIVGADEPVVGPDLSHSARPANLQGGRGLAAGGGVGGSTALIRRGSEALTVAQAWDGPPHGPSLRRASRLADRVLVVVAAGTMSCTEIAQLRSRLGRSNGIGVLLVGLNPEFVKLPDRVGEVAAFWEQSAA
jgi:uncharacterized protein involved in exopolysaccharide biosynthesis